jgi:hypothetical protein
LRVVLQGFLNGALCLYNEKSGSNSPTFTFDHYLIVEYPNLPFLARWSWPQMPWMVHLFGLYAERWINLLQRLINVQVSLAG